MPAERDDISIERDRAWFGDPRRTLLCPNCGENLISAARVFFNSGFGAGIRWGIRRTTQLSPHIAKFVELITYLFQGDQDGLENKYASLYVAAERVFSNWPPTEKQRLELGRALGIVSSSENGAQTTNA